MTVQEFNDLYEISTALAGYQYEKVGIQNPTHRELDTLAGKFQMELMKLTRNPELQAKVDTQVLS